MKAIVLSNWQGASRGEIVEVSQRQLELYPNHLKAAPESLKVVVDAKKEDIKEVKPSDKKYSREELESIENIKDLRKIAEPLGVKGRGMKELVEEILIAQGE